MDGVTAHFFVDEAGDLTLFGRRRKPCVGAEGVSKCFMVGVAQVMDPSRLQGELDALRRELLKDEYLKGVYSMRPEAEKTADFFHAKNDCPEVRREVYKLLARHEIKVQVAVRRKAALIAEVSSGGRLWNPNSVYDNLVKALFKRCLHKADQNIIVFARRGKSAREKALNDAIERAQANFQRDTGIESHKPTQIIPAVPSASHGLQAIDYYLWAIQRLYERGEDRYFAFLAPQFRLIMDFDDKRNATRYGRWYSDSDPLTKEKIMPVEG
jgi:hypothetical protein